MKCKKLIIELPFLNELINDFMATKQELLNTIAAERQQYLDAIAAKDAQITDLQTQLANSITPTDADEIKTGIDGIVS